MIGEHERVPGQQAEAEPNYSDIEVIEGAERPITLGQRHWTLKEPSKRAANRFRRAYQKWATGLQRAQEKNDSNMALDVTDSTVELLYELDPALREHSEEILEHATERQIFAALDACIELTNDPLESWALRQHERVARTIARASKAAMPRNNGGTRTAPVSKP